MSYRDDHQAAIARIDALDHERALLAADNERLARELAAAKEWLGGPRKRLALAAGCVAIVVGFGAGMYAWGRTTAPRPPTATSAAKPAPLPQITGVIVADGPDVGDWMLVATRCAPRDYGVELTATGSEEHNVWLSDGTVELELPTKTITLDARKCMRSFDHALVQTNGVFNGSVQLQCYFDNNRVRGRIDFKHCR